MSQSIPEGEYYDCGGSEPLMHTSAEEAVEAWVDGLCTSPGCDVVEVIRANTPVTLRAFLQGRVTREWISNTAWHLIERCSECFSDEYGDPDGRDDGLDSSVCAEVKPAFVEAVKKLVAHGEVFQCEHVGSVTLDAAQVEAMMRKHRPEWFKFHHDWSKEG